MPSDDLRKRIEALNKRPLHNVPDKGEQDSPEIKALRRKMEKRASVKDDPKPVTQTTPAADVATSPFKAPERIVYSRNNPVYSHREAEYYGEPRDYGPAITLEEAVEGTITQAPAGPGYYHIEKPARDLEPGAFDIHTNFVPLLGHPDGEAAARIAHTCKSNRVEVEEVLFLDLETTGLSMCPVFLVGTMECTPDGFIFKQYFARDYSEEISIVSAISERLKNTRMLITFNGKTFDEPFLRNRSIATGIKPAQADSHLDLLHEARRIYRGKLPNCKLQTLEKYICGRTREDDIPGAEIPAAYHEFVRTGNANKIQSIMMHNLYDILTMADLMSRMWTNQ